MQFLNISITCSMYNSVVLFVHVRVPFVICDEKDLASCVTGMYASSNARRPCNICICDFNNQSIFDLGSLRSLKHMSQVRSCDHDLFYLLSLFIVTV